MTDLPNLVTTCTFKGREYLVKMSVINGNSLDLVVTDKYTAEDWNCSYDASYIENLTHKTGNFKQFEVFITMLKTGLLKTSECVSLDLLTFDDLELLRSRRILSRTSCTPRPTNSSHLIPNSNRRYFILTYTVEFDRIHYPLPMEYCGPPDPQVLQAVIRRLEAEVARLQEQLRRSPADPNYAPAEQLGVLEKRIDQLTSENHSLSEEIKYLNKSLGKRSTSGRQVEYMQQAMKTLEASVFQERTSFNRLVSRLREEKQDLSQQVDEMRRTERGLRKRLSQVATRRVPPPKEYGDARPVPVRKPADGLSPEKRGGGKGGRRSRTRTPSPEVAATNNWDGGLQAEVNLQGMKENLISAMKKKTPVTHSQSVGMFLPVNKSAFPSRHRSTSESSAGSRKQQSANAGAKVAGGGERGRTRTRRDYRSSSATSSSKRAGDGGRAPRPCSVTSTGSSRSCASRNDSGESAGGADGRSRTKTTRVRRKKRGSQALKMGMSDLETRIQALQKLLRKGVGPMKE